MRRVLAFLLTAMLAFGADEIKRPTADSDPGASTWATDNCGIGTYTVNGTSGALSRDAAGQTTSQTFIISGSATKTKLTSRQWTTWSASTQTYTTLTLNINSSSAGSAGSPTNNACLVYTLDSGVTWTKIRCDDSGLGWANVTDSISLSAAQVFSRIRVAVCVLGAVDDGVNGTGSDQATITDIWTDGVYTVTNSGTANSASIRHRGIVF